MIKYLNNKEIMQVNGGISGEGLKNVASTVAEVTMLTCAIYATECIMLGIIDTIKASYKADEDKRGILPVNGS